MVPMVLSGYNYSVAYIDNSFTTVKFRKSMNKYDVSYYTCVSIEKG